MNDLFPETLLVDVRDGLSITNTLKVAAHFRKRNYNVMQTIDERISPLKIQGRDSFDPRISRPKSGPRDLADEEISLPEIGESDRVIRDFWRANFTECRYIDARGKTQRMYEMTEQGFQLLAMSFTGDKAERWKIEYIQAFAASNTRLRVLRDRFGAALDQVRPALRPVVEGTEAGLSRTAIAAPLGKSANAITYHRGSARRLGLLAG